MYILGIAFLFIVIIAVVSVTPESKMESARRDYDMGKIYAKAFVEKFCSESEESKINNEYIKNINPEQFYKQYAFAFKDTGIESKKFRITNLDNVDIKRIILAEKGYAYSNDVGVRKYIDHNWYIDRYHSWNMDMERIRLRIYMNINEQFKKEGIPGRYILESQVKEPDFARNLRNTKKIPEYEYSENLVTDKAFDPRSSINFDIVDPDFYASPKKYVRKKLEMNDMPENRENIL